MKIVATDRRKIKEAFQLFKNTTCVGVDTEGSGLDVYTAKMWSIQISNGEGDEILIPTYDVKGPHMYIGEFEDLLNDEAVIKIFHNAAYDLKVIWRRGWEINNVYDTLVTEKILNAGLWADSSLDGTLRRRFGIEMSKDERKDFYCAEDGKPADERGMKTIFELSGYKWTPELIEYALKDVRHLHQLREEQLVDLKDNKMSRLARDIEQPLVEVTALLEYRGVKIDEEKCKQFQVTMAERATVMKEELIDELDTHWQAFARPIFAKNNHTYLEWKRKYDKVKLTTNKDRVKNESGRGSRLSEEAKQKRDAIKEQMPFRSAPKEPKTININSNYQMRNALEQMGVMLPSLQKAVLQDAQAEHPAIFSLLEYRKYDKLSSMSGGLYEKICEVTGRVHGSLNQDVDTGRYSSTNPNLQNIPSKDEEGAMFRALFIAEAGNTLIISDYAAIELVIIGIMSGDKNLLYALNNVDDLHCYTMSKALECTYDSLVAVKKNKFILHEQGKEVKEARKRFERKFHFPDLEKVSDLSKWVNGLRSHFKNLTYGVAYGISQFGLSRRFHCTPETAQDFIDAFFVVYPTIQRWMDKQSDLGERYGYSTTLSGRRRFYKLPIPVRNKDIEAAVDQYLKNHYKLEKGEKVPHISDEEYNEVWEMQSKKLKREFFALRNRIRRQSANAPIQGSSADITKLAMVRLERWWKPFCAKKGINYYQFGIILTVHDELVFLCPVKYQNEVSKAMQEIMQDAAKEFLGKNVKIEVKPVISGFWTKG